MIVQMMGIMNRAAKIGVCLIRISRVKHLLYSHLLYSWLGEQTCVFKLMNIQYNHANNIFALLLMLLKLLSKTVIY